MPPEACGSEPEGAGSVVSGVDSPLEISSGNGHCAGVYPESEMTGQGSGNFL